MTIELMTRIQSPKLYFRMRDSAMQTMAEPLAASSEIDDIGLPKCAETYNRLAAKSKADIFCFVEDDIEFLSPDWDGVVEDIFLEYGPDILGVVGATQYHGGGPFDTGAAHSVGLIGCNKSKEDEETWVRILSPYYRYKKVKVIDGSLMFVKRAFWEKEPFDEKTFDELFYYDLDACLKSDHVAVTCDILAKHSKPPRMYGVYPKAMKTAGDYEPILLERHGLTKKPPQDQTCCFVSMETFKKQGQTECFKGFERKYQCA